MNIGPGVFVPVVGPSGSGKDSLISHASSHFATDPGIVFARRVITRPADPTAEAHDTLDDPAFEAAERAGAFALSWRSHGLRYGIPSQVDDAIRAGRLVVANLSRASVAEAATRYARVMPVLVTVSPEVLAGRLAARGRESAEEIAARIARNADYGDVGPRWHRIDNSGALEDAGGQFVRLIERAAEHSPAAVV